MTSFSKISIVVFFSLIGFWIAQNIYKYHFDTSIPEIHLMFLEDSKTYKDIIKPVILVKDEYKVKEINIILDNQPIIQHYKINSSESKYNFEIDTRILQDGKHTLEIEAIDASKKNHKQHMSIDFYVDNCPLEVFLIKTDDENAVFQGNTLKIYIQSNKNLKEARLETLGTISYFAKESPYGHVYECFVPISVEERPNQYLASLYIEDFVSNKKELQFLFHILPFNFKTEFIKLHNKKYEEEIGKSEQEFEEIIKEKIKDSPQEKYWNTSFYLPCVSRRISTEFGVIRTSHERGKYRHNALDFAADHKSAIWASENGKIIIKDRFVHTGNTIVIDHGLSMITIYAHLDSFASDIEEGMMIKKGKLIGTVGMTGYATGYHLHWEMRINNIQINPYEWIK